MISDASDKTAAGSETVSEAELDAAMFEMDDDASGTISFKEFYRWWQRKQQRETEARNCWKLTDMEQADGDKLEDARDTISKEDTEVSMAELVISGQPSTGMSEVVETELALDDAVARIEADERRKAKAAKDAKKALKKEKRQARKQRLIRSLNCVMCAKSDRKKAIQNRKNTKRTRKEESHVGSARNQCRKLFNQVDSDGSGLLAIDEIPKLAELLGVQLTPQQQQEAVKEMDADGSGEVDFQEFWQWWVKTGGVDERAQQKHEDTVVGKASVKWAQDMNLRFATVQHQQRQKELKNLASRRGMSAEDMNSVNAGHSKVHTSSVWLKKDEKTGLTMWGRKASGPVGTLGNWETAIETRPQKWQTMSLWMHESDHDFVE